MLLRIFIKKTNEGASTLTVERPDGSVTFSKLSLDFEIHDIVHYVVEKQLGLKNSFYGMLSEGYEINDFQLPKIKRPKALQPQSISPEALVTEHLVNLLTIDYFSPEKDMDLLASLKTALDEDKLPFPSILCQEHLKSIKHEIFELMSNWKTLKSGQALKMELKL